jgi:predicted nucleic acid-binding protein
VIILDTTVVSELFRPAPNRNVMASLSALPAPAFLTAITVAEIEAGLAALPDGQRRRALQRAWQGYFAEAHESLSLPFDAKAAVAFGQIVAARARDGRPIAMADAQIAAIARTNAMSVYTRDVAGFDGLGLDIHDPWKG